MYSSEDLCLLCLSLSLIKVVVISDLSEMGVCESLYVCVYISVYVYICICMCEYIHIYSLRF